MDICQIVSSDRADPSRADGVSIEGALIISSHDSSPASASSSCFNEFSTAINAELPDKTVVIKFVMLTGKILLLCGVFRTTGVDDTSYGTSLNRDE